MKKPFHFPLCLSPRINRTKNQDGTSFFFKEKSKTHRHLKIFHALLFTEGKAACMPVETPRDAAAPRVTGSAEIDEPHPRIVRLLLGEIQGGTSTLWEGASMTSSPVLLGQIQGGIAILWARASTSVKNFVPVQLVTSRSRTSELVFSRALPLQAAS